jgi:hypothetical protein
MKQTQRPRPKKEALFVRIASTDDSVEFHDVSSFIGKPMPFKNPRATLAMRVTDASVAFSLLHLTKRAASGLVAKDVEFPRGPLARLERRISEMELASPLAVDHLLVDINGETQTYTLVRDSNGVIELVGEDGAVELPKSALQITIAFRSPNVKQPIIVGFIGHVGKPETTETVRRAAAMVLFSISQLAQFRVITDVETVKVPSAPRSVARPARKIDERAGIILPTWLYTSDLAPTLVAQGTVGVEIDLETANPATGRLLMQLTPSDDLIAFFDQYRTSIEHAVTQKLRGFLGDDEIKLITVDIVMGAIEGGTVERLRNALETCAVGFDATPTQVRDHIPA